MLTGDNGILTRAEETKKATELARVREIAAMSYLGYTTKMYDEKEKSNMTKTVEEEIKEDIEKAGYIVTTVPVDGTKITGVSLKDGENIITNLKLKNTDSAKNLTIVVDKQDGQISNRYFVLILGKYYEMVVNNNEVIIDSEGMVEPPIQEKNTVSIAETGLTGIIELNNETLVEGNLEVKSGDTLKITPTTNRKSGTISISVSGTTLSSTCKVSIMPVPTESNINTANSNVNFSTKFGTIDVIWLNRTLEGVEEVVNEPNHPVIKNGLTAITLENDGTVNNVSAENTKGTSWYEYKAGVGNKNNTASKWANAINSDGGFFVWIPRFAYRITYYDVENVNKITESTEATGYYDGWGMWRASDAKVKYKLDKDIETVNYNGMEYIVHPAFVSGIRKGYESGQWKEDISGFWIAKYEMTSRYDSVSKSTKPVSLPNREGWWIKIGESYKQSYNYDRANESHLIKNSEWGAVAYLTHSQYGRNGTELAVNNNRGKTGASGGNTNPAWNGTSYEYNTVNGYKASSTGNIYGVYDLSGGIKEYVAAFNSKQSSYEAISNYGWAEENTSVQLSTNSVSTAYQTKYYNTNDWSNTENIYQICKVGEATKEVFVGNDAGWNADEIGYVYPSSPFFARGNNRGNGNKSGIFSSSNSNGCGKYVASGNWTFEEAFRVILSPSK